LPRRHAIAASSRSWSLRNHIKPRRQKSQSVSAQAYSGLAGC
jgi:hypothetical protein